MSKIPNEKVLLEADNQQMILTTHRIRQETSQWGRPRLISILLHKITACELRMYSSPVYLYLAGAAVLVGFLIGGNGFLVGLALGLVMVILYFVTLVQVITVRTCGASMNLNVSRMAYLDAQAFIDQLEAAIHAQDLLRNRNG